MATTPAPNPHNQTTYAQTEVTGKVFLFSFCGFRQVWFLYKMCVSVPWLLFGPLTHVESQDGASEDAVDRQSDDVVVATTPDPHNQTTSAHTEAGGEVFFCEMYGFC